MARCAAESPRQGASRLEACFCCRCPRRRLCQLRALESCHRGCCLRECRHPRHTGPHGPRQQSASVFIDASFGVRCPRQRALRQQPPGLGVCRAVAGPRETRAAEAQRGARGAARLRNRDAPGGGRGGDRRLPGSRGRGGRGGKPHRGRRRPGGLCGRGHGGRRRQSRLSADRHGPASLR